MLPPSPEVDAFLTFGREELKRNQPTTVEHMGDGLSLRLQDSTIVTLIADAAAMSDALGYAPITNPKSPGAGIASTHSWQVGGKHG